MSARYGRNKRRRDAEALAKATVQIDRLKWEGSHLARKLELQSVVARDAYERGINDTVNSKGVDAALAKIAQRLADKFGPEISGAAMELLASTKRQREKGFEPVDFDVAIDPKGTSQMMIRGRIKECTYAVILPAFP